MKYVLIEIKSHIKSMMPAILESIHTLLEIFNQSLDGQVFSFYTEETDGVIKDTLTNLSHEWVIDFKIFISSIFSEEPSIVKSLFIKTDYKHTVFLDDKDIYLIMVKESRKEELQSIILKEFINDIDMKQTIKTFIESNQNSTQASQMLYIHRNTLNQRLDKFTQRTGLNPKNFKDAYIIYYLLT